MWRKSSRSGDNANCVEVAREVHAVGVRDSKNVTGPVLAFSSDGFAGFLDELKNDRFVE